MTTFSVLIFVAAMCTVIALPLETMDFGSFNKLDTSGDGNRVAYRPEYLTPAEQSSKYSLTTEDPTLSEPVLPLAPLDGDTSEDDNKIKRDWGINCTVSDWKNCSKITTFGKDVWDETGRELLGRRQDCSNRNEFPPLCLVNRWTVTRCHIFCMAMRCNKHNLLTRSFESYVRHEGACKTK